MKIQTGSAQSCRGGPRVRWSPGESIGWNESLHILSSRWQDWAPLIQTITL